jgi:arylsulfatase A-like enzyme
MSASAAIDPRPSIVFVLTDDLDAASLDALPGLRALLSDRGTTFSRFFVSDSLCCPSRSTILCGQFDHNHHVLGNFPPDGGFRKFAELGHESATIATLLHDAGYRTGLLGKYLNGYPEPADPTHVPPGWDEWDSPTAGTPYAGLDYDMNEDGTIVHYAGEPGDYFTDVVSGMAVRFVQGAASDPRPFFLYVAPYAPHLPATPPERYRRDFERARAPRSAAFNEKDTSDKPDWLRAVPPLDRAAIDRIDEIYRRRLASMEAVQDLVANVIDALAAAGRLDRTYIVFTSDNGFHMGEHRLVPGKQTPYEEDIHVPLIVRGPGVPLGAVRSELTGNVDLAPTFAELAQFPWVDTWDGRSLVPLLGGGPSPSSWRGAYLLEHTLFTGSGGDGEGFSSGEGAREPADPFESASTPKASHPRVPSFKGLRTADTLYVEYADGERELYDLSADPEELQNLVASADAASLAAFSGRLRRLALCAGQSCRTADGAGPG